MDILARIIQAAGTKAELARLLNVFPQVIDNWCKRGIPFDRIPAIELALKGKVRCEQMCDEVTWERDRKGRVVGYRVKLDQVSTPTEQKKVA